MSEQIRIDNLGALESVLERGSVGICWTLFPHEPSMVWISPSTLQLEVDGAQIPESAFTHQLKQFLSNTIGLFSHTPGATLTAKGTIGRSRELGSHYLEISIDYFESPDVPESCDSGTLSSWVLLDELRYFLQSGY